MGTVRRGAVRSGLDRLERRGAVRTGLDRFGAVRLERNGAEWNWPGEDWTGAERSGEEWCGWRGWERFGQVRNGWSGMARNGGVGWELDRMETAGLDTIAIGAGTRTSYPCLACYGTYRRPPFLRLNRRHICMSQRPWFPLYPGAYRADTAHLTAEEHGCYLLLLCHAWTHDGLIPEAVSRRAAICNMHTNRFKKVWETLGGYWNKTGGGFSNPRLNKELAQAVEISEKRRKAAESRHHANAHANAHTRARDATVTYTEATNVASSDPPSANATGGSAPARQNGGAGAPLAVPFEKIKSDYNALAAELGLPACRVLTPQRKVNIAARFREHPEPESWENFWLYVRDQPFLYGKNDRGWRASLEWLMKPSNFAKVIEEYYVAETRN